MLDAGSGQVRVAPGSVLDFETASSHTLLLRVTDAQGVSTQQAIVVTLHDLADTPDTPGPDPAPLPDPTPPPAAAPAPAPTPQPAAPPTPVAETTASSDGRESAGGRSTTPTRVQEDRSDNGRSLVADALNGLFGGDADRRTGLSAVQRAQREGEPLLVAGVSFDLAGANLNPASLDALLLQGLDAANSSRLGLLASLRGAALDTGAVEDAARHGADEGASRGFVAAVQDPVRVASATLTAGFVWWLTRSGGLLTSILMGIPAWRHVDLLPVLAPRGDDDDEQEDDNDDADTATDAASSSFDAGRDSAVEDLFANSISSRMFGDSRFMT
jgi:hypothetical protein